jgi:tripartite ATP-independent transporter DctP family solute receptor
MNPKSRWSGRQFHNQPEESHTHRFLVELWDEVTAQTGGALRITVHADNGGIPGSDPVALQMLVDGELELMTLMGGILGGVVPVAEIQGTPFAFRDHRHVHAAMRGALGDYIRSEMTAKGIHGFRHGVLENGFRHIFSVDKPVRSAADLAGYRMRIPASEMFAALFRALGAHPVPINIRDVYDSLVDKIVDGQENPLVVTEVNRLYEVTHYASLTGHMWSGFNMIANLDFWRALPEDVQEVVERAVGTHVQRQRSHTEQLNHDLEAKLRDVRGMQFNTADTDSFRAALAGEFYRRWKTRLGLAAWGLLEAEAGKLV